ncbi:YqaJ viral recombinase family protein [Biostraticola tofi]|uniref:Putative phage-related endonuclease n=1 Tax=Biostraticola tofi TaxID=466109 RepID=A0A4R3Z5B9_9GAMM|nr:YqaJ viral recombinase family protein [Biostraticola tofi]TCW00437.1 putative phage-related endonuclease [Biostraticola tofi]
MQVINVQQGTDEWLSLRAKHFTASEAPVMMAASSKATRDELLRVKATGSDKKISEWVQKYLFDKGHDYENMARPIVEALIGEELFPATAIDDDGYLLASFDGMTMMEDTLFEHKMWNGTLPDAVRAGDLPAEYYWQLEQQLLVSGAERVIFVVSDGTENNFEQMEYRPVPGRAEELIAGWRQFETDLNNYTVTAAKEVPVGKAIMRLPALKVEIEGDVKQSNLAIYQSQALAFIQSINTELTTDQDFADAEETVKFCEKAESELDLIKQQALSQTEKIDLLFRTIDTLREEMRSKRLTLTKLVKTRKDEIRGEIVMRAKTDLAQHIAELNKRLAVVSLPVIQADFVTAIKGKKTLTSLQGAANDELARAKIEATRLSEKYASNLELFTDIEPAYQNLFADKAQLVAHDKEHLRLLIEQRISKQKEAEEQQKERERQLIIAREKEAEDARLLASTVTPAEQSYAQQEHAQTSQGDTATIIRPTERVVSKPTLLQGIQADIARAGITMNLTDVEKLSTAIKAGRVRAFSANY